MFWAIPLSTKQKDFDFYFNFTDPNGQKVSAILAQMKLVSVKRLKRDIYIMPKEDLRDLQRQLSLIKRSLKTSGGGLSSQKGWPSTGLAAISILLSYVKSITICGFDFFQTDDRQSEHYYDDKHGFIKTKCHKGEYEKEWILKKQKTGQIIIL